MHNEKKPRSGFVRTAFSIAASGALVLSMTPAAWAVETSAGNGTEFAESVQVVDASTATSFEVAESATTLTFSNDGITASGTLNVDGTACSVQRPSTQSRCASLRQALQRCGSKSQSMGWQHRVRFSKCPIGRYG